MTEYSTCGHLLWPSCGCRPGAPPSMPPAPTPRPASPFPELEEPGPPPSREPTLGEMIAAEAETPEGRAELLRQVRALYAEASFAEFCRQAWHTVEPSTKLEWNWHHDLICMVVQGMFEEWMRAKDDELFVQQVRNAVLNVPPGSLKSRLLSVFFPVWCWVHRPGWKVICLSVNEDATLRDARASREVIRSKWYQESFRPDWKIKGDQDAVSNYGNTAGGERLSRPQGSEIVGLRADALIIDDPNNPLEAENRKTRDDVNALWDTNIFNRVNDLRRSLRIGVQQRTNAGDWTGHVIQQTGAWSPTNPDGWLWVVLPAEFELARRCVTPWGSDPRTIEGESIQPSRLPASVLESERRRFRWQYAGQMQQRPTLAEGGRVQRAYWGFCRLAAGVRPEVDELGNQRPRPARCSEGDALVIPKAHHAAGWDLDWIVISVDPAAKKTERGSLYGMLVIAGKGGRRFVLDDRSQRGELPEIIAVLKKMIQVWAPDRVLIEAKAAGGPIMETLQECLASGDIRDAQNRPMMVVLEAIEPGSADKEVRLEACLPYLEMGMVYLLDGAPWLDDFVEELSLFPQGLHDDRVDALSQCLNCIRTADDSLPDW